MLESNVNGFESKCLIYFQVERQQLTLIDDEKSVLQMVFQSPTQMFPSRLRVGGHVCSVFTRCKIFDIDRKIERQPCGVRQSEEKEKENMIKPIFLLNQV